VTAPVCESAQNKLLSQGCTDALSCLDREVPKHEPRAAIRSGVVKVRESG